MENSERHSEKPFAGSFPQHYSKSMHRGCSVLYGQKRTMPGRLPRHVQPDATSAEVASDPLLPPSTVKLLHPTRSSSRHRNARLVTTQARSFSKKADSDRSGQVAAVAGGDQARRLDRAAAAPTRSSGWAAAKTGTPSPSPESNSGGEKTRQNCNLAPEGLGFISHPKTWQVGQLQYVKPRTVVVEEAGCQEGISW
jgi:hypothetical protein